MGQELRRLKGCTSQEAQTSFIGGSGGSGLLGQRQEAQEGMGEGRGAE